jgi:hypothetical protein
MLSGRGLWAGDSHFSSPSAQVANYQSVASAMIAQASARLNFFAAFGSPFSTSGTTVLTASLSDPNSSATGSATFNTATENGVSETELKVSVTGATASSTLDVLVGGTKVGMLSTDSTGAGSVVLSTDPKGTEQAFTTPPPTNVAAGTTVSAGTVTGNLATPTYTGGGGGCEGSNENETVLTTALTSTTTSATGTATFKSETENGVAVTILKLSVTGATASSTLNVLVGTTIVGTLTTDSTGAGTAVFSTNPTGTEKSFTTVPTGVTATTAVSVDSLSGTLAAATNTEGGCESSQQIALAATLTDPNGTGTGTATYKTSASETELKVSVTGATASSTLNVLVGTTTVGTLTTDSTGAGTAVFSTNPRGTEKSFTTVPTGVTATTTVSVGSLSGTFTASSSFGWHVFRHFRHRW